MASRAAHSARAYRACETRGVGILSEFLHIPRKTTAIIGSGGKSTLLRVELVTGKPHQIRSHLAFLGHPVAGDQKYGDFVQNSFYRKKYQLTHQLLHAWEIDFPDDSSLGQLAGKKVQAPLPSLFLEILRGEGLDKFLGGQERRGKNVWQ